MEKFQRECIGLIRGAFVGQADAPSSSFDWIKAVNTAQKHNIAPILYYGAINCGVSRDGEHMQLLHRLTLRSLMTSTKQSYEIEKITNAFEKEGIKYMPLKGAILKPLFPHPEMRTMGDADVLIMLEQYSEIQKVMEQLGFAFQYESDHELVWQKPSLFLELHKSIMTTYNRDFYRYFGNGWKLARPVPGTNRYEMAPEDFYIYIFVHFAKHYRISGIGIKHLIDLWVYVKAHSELDWMYITRELKKMELLQFHQNITKTIDVWFEKGEETEITDLITNVIFHSGQYGSADMAIVNRALQNGTQYAWIIKLKIMCKAVFLPYSAMKEKYGVLRKICFLLPIMWIVRCVEVLFCKTGRLVNYVNGMKKIDSGKVKENRWALHVVGLDFHNEE